MFAFCSGEPQHAVLVEERRVRIARRRFGHRVFGDLAGLRIELADVAASIGGEPDVAVRCRSSRPCGPDPGVFSGYSLISPVFGSTRPSTFANMPVHQIEPSGAARGSCGREPSDGTIHSLDVHACTAPGTTTGFGPRLLGEVLRQVRRRPPSFGRRQRHHRAEELFPVPAACSRPIGDQPERVALGALRLHGGLARTIGQRDRLRRGRGPGRAPLPRDADQRKRREEQSERSNGGCVCACRASASIGTATYPERFAAIPSSPEHVRRATPARRSRLSNHSKRSSRRRSGLR